MKKILLLFLCVGTMSVSHAQLLTENFSYTSTGTPANNTLTAISNSRWTRHSGSITPILWNATGLTYAGYSGSNIGGSVTATHGTGSREDANTPLSDNVTTGSVYLSYMLNVTASGGTTGDFNVNFTSGSGTDVLDFGGRVFVKDGSTAGTFKLGLSKNSAPAAAAVFTTADYNLNTTYLVVSKYTFNTGTTTSDDVASAYIFTSGVPSIEPTVAHLVATDIARDLPKIYSVCIRQGVVGTASAILDGFIVSQSWPNAVIPVTLSSFDAVGSKDQVDLKWVTASEINSQSFEVERSTDGSNFKSIASVKAKGSSTSNSSYQITDKNLPASSTLYYRLRQVDVDGTTTYSKIVTVAQTGKGKGLKVHPNPVSNVLTVEYTEGSLFQVINLLGQQVLVGKTTQQIDVSSLAKGTYMLKVGTEVAKFVKQ